jgi:rSAM/selenodomain-associated transferase 1
MVLTAHQYTCAVFRTIPPPPERALVFARLPELGKVKTRLAQSIGEAKALAVYEAMLRDLLASIGPSSERTEIEILWAPTDAANGDRLARAFDGYPTAMQTGDTLGDRMAMAFSERFFFHRTEKIVAIGVDDPRLSRGNIDQALALLDSCEWVLGPASDGGYYLIGCRAPAFDSVVFADMEWGSSSVLQETLARIAASQQTVAMLPERYDIDVEADLRRYAADGDGGSLAGLLREWEGRGMLNAP